jgi:hypothetical protein
MKIFVSMVVLLTLCTFPLLSQESKPLTLKGVVVRQDGTGLRAASVFVRDYQAGTQWEMHTEADGGFLFVVHPGCYDVFISLFHKRYFFLFPFSQRICVKAETFLRLRLSADPHPRLRID